MNGTEFRSYQFPSGSISSERHPTDNLVDNPTVVFFSFIFLLRFFSFLNREERDLLRDQNMKFPSASWEEIKQFILWSLFH